MCTLKDHGPVVDLIIGNIEDEYLNKKMNIMDLIVRISIVLTTDENKYVEACSMIDVHSNSNYYALVFPFNLLVRQESRLLIILIKKEISSSIPNVVELNQMLPQVKLKFRNKPMMGKDEIKDIGKWIIENFNN